MLLAVVAEGAGRTDTSGSAGSNGAGAGDSGYRLDHPAGKRIDVGEAPAEGHGADQVVAGVKEADGVNGEVPAVKLTWMSWWTVSQITANTSCACVLLHVLERARAAVGRGGGNKG